MNIDIFCSLVLTNPVRYRDKKAIAVKGGGGFFSTSLLLRKVSKIKQAFCTTLFRRRILQEFQITAIFDKSRDRNRKKALKPKMHTDMNIVIRVNR